MKDHIIRETRGKEIEILPIATIYGANASGKTNLINALDFAQDLIVNGTKSRRAYGNQNRFLLDIESERTPSRFEFVFKHAGILYTVWFLGFKARDS